MLPLRAIPPALLLLGLTLAACPSSSRRGGPDAAARARRSRRAPADVPEQGPVAQKILYEQAKSLLRAGRTDKAVEVFRRAIEAHDKGELLPSCYLGLGSALGEMSRHDEAVRAYKKVVRLRPDDPEAYRALAIGQEGAGQLAAARQSLTQSLALDADQLSAYQDLAALHLRDKDLQSAREIYTRYELRRTALIRTLGLSEEIQSRVQAAQALGGARDEATVKALGLALSDASRPVRLAVIHALGQQGLAAGAGPLRELLSRTVDAEEQRLIKLSLQAISNSPQPTPAPPPPRPGEQGGPLPDRGAAAGKAGGSAAGTGAGSAAGTGAGSAAGTGPAPDRGRTRGGKAGSGAGPHD